MSETVTPSSNLSSFLGSNPTANRLYDNVQATVPGVTLAVLKMDAWNTIEEFYIRSTARRAWVEFGMPIGSDRIDFNPYDETWVVAWVLAVRGIHRHRIIPPAVLVDECNPEQARVGRVLLALKPASFNTNLPEELFSNWFETILSGTLFRLYATPAKPYTNPQAAAYHGKKWMAGISRARDIAQRDYTDGPGRWRFPYFSRGREAYWR